jgi:sigma-E factor negative regulatory protein RseB
MLMFLQRNSEMPLACSVNEVKKHGHHFKKMMNHVPVLRLGMAILLPLVLSAHSVRAQSTEQPDSKKELLAYLQKTQTAAQKLSYTGTFVYQQANQIRTSKITHMLDASGELEKLEILDGKPREYIRHNDEVACYLPESKIVQIEKNVSQEVFPALLSGNPNALAENYTISKAAPSWVAGIECLTLMLEPKDKNRYGYRLCIDKNNGLLLRAQTLNSRNEVIEQIAFTQIAAGNIDKAHFKPSFPNVSQWQVEHLNTQSNLISGWDVKSLPAGFKKTREMKRIIPILQNAASASDASSQEKTHQVIQMIFSDGLSAISVFVEPDTQSRTEGSLQQGAMTIMGKRQGDYWLTIVGEVPLPAIKQVANSIEHKPK